MTTRPQRYAWATNAAALATTTFPVRGSYVRWATGAVELKAHTPARKNKARAPGIPANPNTSMPPPVIKKGPSKPSNAVVAR